MPFSTSIQQLAQFRIEGSRIFHASNGAHITIANIADHKTRERLVLKNARAHAWAYPAQRSVPLKASLRYLALSLGPVVGLAA
jgi:hypothetical protein